MNKFKFKKSLMSVIFSTVLLSSCAAGQLSNDGGQSTNSVNYADSINPFIQNNYAAADVLISQLKGQVNLTNPIIIATLVNIDDLNNSSTFGRLVSEQVSARFSQHKYSMLELKFRGYVYMKQDQGELLLTREIKDVAQSHNAQAVIVGTYALSRNTIFVNIKVIQPNTNIVLAVHDYTFPLDSSMSEMTRSVIRKY